MDFTSARARRNENPRKKRKIGRLPSLYIYVYTYAPIELVEASPGAGLREPGEHAAHALVIEALRAVDDDDVEAEGFAEILDGLGLAGTGRALRAPAPVQVQRRRQRNVASVLRASKYRLISGDCI